MKGGSLIAGAVAGVVDFTAEFRDRLGVELLGVTRLYRGGLLSEAVATTDDVPGTAKSLLLKVPELVEGCDRLLLLAFGAFVEAECDEAEDVEGPSGEVESSLRATFDGRASHNLALFLKS